VYWNFVYINFWPHKPKIWVLVSVLTDHNLYRTCRFFFTSHVWLALLIGRVGQMGQLGGQGFNWVMGKVGKVFQEGHMGHEDQVGHVGQVS
jgi:hypothetical protein